MAITTRSASRRRCGCRHGKAGGSACLTLDQQELRVDAAEADGGRYAVESEHVGGGAVVDEVLFAVGRHGREAAHHYLVQAGVDQVFVPEVALAVLHPRSEEHTSELQSL